MKDPSEVPFFPQLCDENTWLAPSYDNYGRSVVIYHEILCHCISWICWKDRISRLNSHRAQQHQMHTTEASGPNSQHTPKHDGNTPSHHLGKPVYIWSYPFLISSNDYQQIEMGETKTKSRETKTKSPVDFFGVSFFAFLLSILRSILKSDRRKEISRNHYVSFQAHFFASSRYHRILQS